MFCVEKIKLGSSCSCCCFNCCVFSGIQVLKSFSHLGLFVKFVFLFICCRLDDFRFEEEEGRGYKRD